jgi:hypothetical protein
VIGVLEPWLDFLFLLWSSSLLLDEESFKVRQTIWIGLFEEIAPTVPPANRAFDCASDEFDGRSKTQRAMLQPLPTSPDSHAGSSPD